MAGDGLVRGGVAGGELVPVAEVPVLPSSAAVLGPATVSRLAASIASCSSLATIHFVILSAIAALSFAWVVVALDLEKWTMPLYDTTKNSFLTQTMEASQDGSQLMELNRWIISRSSMAVHLIEPTGFNTPRHLQW